MARPAHPVLRDGMQPWPPGLPDGHRGQAMSLTPSSGDPDRTAELPWK